MTNTKKRTGTITITNVRDRNMVKLFIKCPVTSGATLLMGLNKVKNYINKNYEGWKIVRVK